MKKVKWSILVLILFWFGGITQVQGEMESFESLKPLCDKNIFHSCFKLGERFRVLDRDNKKALPYFEKACLGDHLTACSHAGLLLFMKGTPYSDDYKKATKYFEKACNGKHDKACYNLGSLKYKEGRQKKAIKYYDIACKLKNQGACAKSKKLKR